MNELIINLSDKIIAEKWRNFFSERFPMNLQTRDMTYSDMFKELGYDFDVKYDSGTIRVIGNTEQLVYFKLKYL